MNAKIHWMMGVIAILPPFHCAAATNYSTRSSPSSSQMRPISVEDREALVRQFKIALKDLRHELSNHESEIRMFEEKLQNQETMIDQIRQQLANDLQTQKDYTRATSVNLEGKIENLDHSVKGLMTDLRQLKTQANDSVEVLTQYKQKFAEFGELIDVQNQHMANLETALRSIMDVLQAKEAATQLAAAKATETGKTYKVQSGDTLEKIARAHKVTVQILRDRNQLSSDRIVVGQTLKIP